MGRPFNTHSRVWNPWGAWTFGEEIEESAHRKNLDGLDEYQNLPSIRFYKNRCHCCRRKYTPEKITGLLCERCRPHSVCLTCGQGWGAGGPSSRGVCDPCREEIRKHWILLATFPRERQMEVHKHWSEEMEARRIPNPKCPIFHKGWFDEFVKYR